MTDADYQALFNPKVAEAIKTFTKAGGFPALVGMEVDVVEPGRVVCRVPHRAELMNAVGMMHGGVVAALIDHVLSVTVYPLVEVGKWVATLEFKANYMGTITKGDVVATGTVLSLRRRIAVVQVVVENEGSVVAQAQGTLYIKERPA